MGKKNGVLHQYEGTPSRKKGLDQKPSVNRTKPTARRIGQDTMIEDKEHVILYPV